MSSLAFPFQLRNRLDNEQSPRRIRRCTNDSEVWISDIEYADDVVILADTPENLNSVHAGINHFANSVGLEINTS